MKINLSHALVMFGVLISASSFAQSHDSYQTDHIQGLWETSDPNLNDVVLSPEVIHFDETHEDISLVEYCGAYEVKKNHLCYKAKPTDSFTYHSELDAFRVLETFGTNMYVMQVDASNPDLLHVITGHAVVEYTRIHPKKK
jgi:hypothetical protein